MISTVHKKQQSIGQLAIFATAVLWSTSGLFIKLLDWNPVLITGARSLVAGIFILIIRLIFPPPKEARKYPVLLWAAAICCALTMFAFVIANKITSSVNAIMLQYSAPVWAALLGWLLIKEKPHWEHWGALVLVIGGLLLFFRGGLGKGRLLGDILAVLSGILLAAHSVFLRMMKDGNPRDAMLLAHVLSAVIGIPFFLIYPPVVTVSSVMVVFFMGTLQLGLTSLLFTYGLKRVRAMEAMLIASAEPILNPVWVLAITGEKPSPEALAGGAIIIVAVVASSMIGKRREERETEAGAGLS